ncbi:branched-chain amino acid ABC transporter permease [Alcaligenes sp. WGS1538]|uniref:branched-chain amino acid ABC transporter permease n=1 Tax=Alcaligenes sp. WGS1538 TaxID=3366811 RepID=UPI00372D716A
MRTRSTSPLSSWLWPALASLVLLSSAAWGDPFLWRFATEALLIGCAVLSINLLIGYGGLVSLGHGAVFGFAGYATAIASQSLGASLPLVLAVGILAGVLLSVLMALVSLRTSDLFFLVTTLVAGQLVWEVAFRWRELTGGADGLRGFPRLSLGDIPLSAPYTLMTLALALALLCWLLLRSFSRAPIGLALVGLRDQPLRMAALGYQAWRIRLCAFMTAGAVAGAAGGLYPFANQYVSPQQVHWSFSATLIIMGVIGGIRTWRGAFMGATVYLFAQTYLSSYTDRWQLLVGLIFVATVLFMPNGLAERRRRSS